MVSEESERIQAILQKYANNITSSPGIAYSQQEALDAMLSELAKARITELDNLLSPEYYKEDSPLDFAQLSSDPLIRKIANRIIQLQPQQPTEKEE